MSIDIDDVKVLCLGPNDTLVVQVPRLTPSTRQQAFDHLSGRFPQIDGRILIIDADVQLAVLQAGGGQEV